MTAMAHDPALDQGLFDELDRRGVRYQVIDGTVVVTPPTTFDHEDLGASLLTRLRSAAPPGLAVLGANYGFYYDEPSFLLPDITVARREDCQDKGLFVAPLLVVEVLSHSTRRYDLAVKWDIYAESGVPSYWLLDPWQRSLTILELRDDTYIETGRIEGQQELRVERPFPVTVRLSV